MKLKKLLIATKNAGKFSEIAEVLGELPIKLISLANLGIADDVEEHGNTHEENAILKAQYFFGKTGLPTLAEDSGIYVDAFHGELGVQTRRWGGLEKATDEEWIKYFLRKMRDVPEAARGAEFRCFAALILDAASAKKPFVFSGAARGIITKDLQSPLIKGIPISSCFRPDGAKKVYAALAPHEKNRISHRGKAMHAVKIFLAKFAA